uniref:tRNA-dihydrouridine(47) synthase [NAD(P)(+)] n=1 Tax=Ornithorhynchus anatinus TaxID=9258 RepID=A0A6I8NWA1_ORNAN
AWETAMERKAGGCPSSHLLNQGVRLCNPLLHRYLTTKEQFHTFLETKGKDAEGQGTEKPTGRDAEEEEPICQGLPEPTTKKIKLEDEKEETQGQGAEEVEQQQKRRARGQNKNRPHVKPTHYSENKLCPSVIQASADKCFFGERCRFLHNLASYMATKPPDLGDRCVLFDTFGKCIYGVTCRFAGAHLGERQQNLVDEERAAQWRDRQLVRNSLSKELQQQLRKKKVLFSRSERYLRQLNKPSAGKGRTPDPGAGGSAGSGGREGPAPAEEAPSLKLEGQEPQPGGLEEEPRAGGGASPSGTVQTSGPLTDEDVIRLRPAEKKELDIRGKLYLAPLTTCGNLPFRRICKRFGADVTCGEMAVCTNLLQGQSSEWALLKRHHSEDLFGVQLEGAFPDTMTKCAELLNQTVEVDFVDINVGCPIDLVYKKGGGCALMNRSNKFEQIVRGMNSVLDVPLTVKIRTGVQEKANLAHRLLPELRAWGVSLVTVSRRQGGRGERIVSLGSSHLQGRALAVTNVCRDSTYNHWDPGPDCWDPYNDFWDPTHNHWDPTHNHWDPTHNHWDPIPDPQEPTYNHLDPAPDC